jgi:KaiC/GvpD/RAD55 family RecA-like ATPase
LASTGITSLDTLLGSDGYPAKSTVLIVGPPGIGKELLLYKFMSSGMVQNDFCFYITKRSVDDVLHDSKAFGFDTELSKVSLWMASKGGQLKFNIDDLSNLSFTVKEILKQKKENRTRIALDALSSILMLNPPDTIYRFLSQLFAEFKEHDLVLLATLEEGMHPPQVFSAMGELFDGVVELKLFEEGMKIIPILRIKKMRGLAPQPTYYNFTYSRSVGLEVSPYVR